MSLTGGVITTVYGTVGTSPVVILAAGKAIRFLRIHCPSNSGILAVTYDGVTVPVVYGAGSVLLAPFATDEWVAFVAHGAITIVASVANTPYTILYSS